ncbi:MAG: response regulator [Deltaproteobacteria bacterium]|nr:response regulator [Deltaproteobacteria bacterium]
MKNLSRFRNSIAIPIIFILLVLTAGILLAGYYINKKVFYNVFEEREKNHSKNIHLAIESMLSSEEKRLDSFAKVLERDTDISYSLYHYKLTGGDLKPLKSVMNQLYSQMSLPLFFMANPKGNILYRADKTKEVEQLSSFAAFRKAIKGERVITATRSPGGWGLRAIVPIHAFETRALSGVLILGSRIDDDFAKNIAKETGSQIFIATAEGTIAGSYRPRNPSSLDLSMVKKSLLGKTPLFFADRGNFRSYTYVPIRIIDEEFCLIVETDINVVKELLSKNRLEMAQWGLILFLGVTLIGAALTFALIHPLNQLQEKARRVVREYSGDDSRAAPRGNEISTLVRAFNLMVETIRDHISERSKTEEALRETGRMLQALIEASPLAILVTDASGHIKIWNPAAERIFGWSENEAIGRDNPICSKEGNSRLRTILNLTLRGEKFSNIEVRGRGKEDFDVDLAFYGAPLVDGHDRIIGMTAIMADITDSKRAEEALRRSEEELRQSQKMEAIGKLAGGVAHDFNNLLSVITGYSELLLGRLGKDSPGFREIEVINQAGERAASLTHQLLAFSRRQVLNPKILRMDEAVSSLGKMLCRLIGENIDLVTSVDADLWTVRADPIQIDQVILNLAVNARDAMPSGGKLSISTSNIDIALPLVEDAFTIPAGQYVGIEVTDTGCGMDEDTIARIFEPFFTTKKHGKGTGLGLATVYGIVKQSGGYIRVLSKPGIGTTFIVYFPRAQGTEPAEKAAGTGTEDMPSCETILLVEDEDMVRELACEALRGYGYNVLEASNGQEAISIGGKHDGAIHLLITDVVMPGINGLELSRTLKSSRPEMPVLFMSGYSEEVVAQEGFMSPGDAFFQKPVTPSRLHGKIREILRLTSPQPHVPGAIHLPPA